MKSASPYLSFPGTAEEAFLFYRSVFGGEFAALHRFGDGPDAAKVPAADRAKLMHVSLPLAHGTMLMASDCCASMGQQVHPGDNFSIYLETDSEAETSRLFAGLVAGGTPIMPPAKTFWGAFFGMLTDRFGIRWMLGYTYPKPASD